MSQLSHHLLFICTTSWHYLIPQLDYLTNLGTHQAVAMCTCFSLGGWFKSNRNWLDVEPSIAMGPSFPVFGVTTHHASRYLRQSCRGGCETGAGGQAKAANPMGVVFLSLLVEFWLTDGDEPVPVTGFAGLSPAKATSALSPPRAHNFGTTMPVR